MSNADTAPSQTDRVLVELWTLTFGEPPPVVHDARLMMQLIETELAGRRRSAGAAGH